MEVHQHVHSARKKWGHYFWEFFMLFLAITTGFFVENLREHYIEHKRAKAYARMLKNDLVSDTADIFVIERQVPGMKKAQSALKNIFKKQKSEITVADLRGFRGYEFETFQSVFSPHDAIYSELKNSGALRYFTNLNIINKLTQYEWTIKKFSESHLENRSYLGGVQSSQMLLFETNYQKFLDHTSLLEPEMSAEKSGYGFQLWDERQTILSNMIFILNRYIDSDYPKFKKDATEIIEILNKEYHLK
ncbi:MAG TPA: hypothetical protein VLJ68_09625 [Chitinophagaceae bacterium]|nr:hypothetical protein [Chitinophagaceae bacterium]